MIKIMANTILMRIFSNILLFSGKTAFMQISADFVTGFEKSSSEKVANRFKNLSVAQVVPEIYRVEEKYATNPKSTIFLKAF